MRSEPTEEVSDLCSCQSQLETFFWVRWMSLNFTRQLAPFLAEHVQRLLVAGIGEYVGLGILVFQRTATIGGKLCAEVMRIDMSWAPIQSVGISSCMSTLSKMGILLLPSL